MQSKSIFIQIFLVVWLNPLNVIDKVFASEPSETSNIQLIQSKALVFAAQGNYSEAVYILQSAIEQEPSNYQLIFTCAKFAQKSKNIPLALELYQNLYEKAPDLYSTRLELTELSLASGDYEKALSIITPLTQKPIEHESVQNQGFETLQTFRAHLYRGMAHFYKQQYEEAKRYLVPLSVTASPYQSKSLFFLAKVNERMNDRQSSQDNLNKALQLDPKLKDMNIKDNFEFAEREFTPYARMSAGLQYDSNVMLLPQVLVDEFQAQGSTKTGGMRVLMNAQTGAVWKLPLLWTIDANVGFMSGTHLSDRSTFKENDFFVPSGAVSLLRQAKPREYGLIGYYKTVFLNQFEQNYSGEFGVQTLYRQNIKRISLPFGYTLSKTDFHSKSNELDGDNNRDNWSHEFSLWPSLDFKALRFLLSFSYEMSMADGKNYDFSGLSFIPMVQSKITKNLISSLSIGSIYRNYHAFSSDTLGERKELLFTSSLQIAMKMSDSFQTKLGLQLNKNQNIGKEGQIAPFDYSRYLGTIQIDYHY